MANLNRAFVTGYPVKHSLSPIIHQYWLQSYNLSGDYQAIEIMPENFTKFIKTLEQEGFCGGNVTLPHKEMAYQLVDHLGESAAMIGAVNTLWFENGLLYGDNTDAYGFAANLDDYYSDWGGENAVVIGAGGAARAILYALKCRGFKKIYLLNRTRLRADNLAAHFGTDLIEVGDWHESQKFFSCADLIVNTTSLGMHGVAQKDEDAFPFDFNNTQSHALATDIVYTPLITPFLQQARQAGLPIADGLGMLLHQAVPGFEKWFGYRPAVTAQLRSLVEKKMGIEQA